MQQEMWKGLEQFSFHGWQFMPVQHIVTAGYVVSVSSTLSKHSGKIRLQAKLTDLDTHNMRTGLPIDDVFPDVSFTISMTLRHWFQLKEVLQWWLSFSWGVKCEEYSVVSGQIMNHYIETQIHIHVWCMCNLKTLIAFLSLESITVHADLYRIRDISWIV